MSVPPLPFPQPGFTPGAPAPRSGPGWATRLFVLALLAVIIGGYVLAVLLTRSIWSDREAIRVTLTAHTLDGSAPSPDAMARTQDIVKARLNGLGLSGTKVITDGGTLLVTVPGRDPDAVRDAVRTGQLYVRPVIHAMPTEHQPSSTQAPGGQQTDRAQRIADEKQLRQSTDPSIQILALQFQATRCGEEDVLAGNDNPNLPLVTCSTDGQTVYLLNKAIVSGADIRNASSGLDSQQGQYVVDVEFKSEGAKTWADFTAANVGTQTAFTLDSQVVSTPEIREAIPGGRTQITGNFNRESAREFAGVLGSGALPLSLSSESSVDDTLPPTTFSTVIRALVITSGIGLAALTLGAGWYLLSRSRHVHRSAVLDQQ